MNNIIAERKKHILKKQHQSGQIACDEVSLAGAVSQRACVYSGARVALNPITDVVHLVHGSIGCASYTTDIRGSKSSGAETYRKSFSTDLKEKDIIFGGEKKLYKALTGLADRFNPPAIFVYATCTVGIIGDDIKAVCQKAETETGVKVVPIQSEGFKGNKAAGYKAACDALLNYVIGTVEPATQKNPYSINILGDFNIAGDLWAVKPYLEKMGVKITSSITGDGRFNEIAAAHHAKLNLVQCSGSMTYLAKKMEAKYAIPFKRISFFGFDEMAEVLTFVADFFGDTKMIKTASQIIDEEKKRVYSGLQYYRQKVEGKKAAVYMGGAAKALALVRNFKLLGMDTIIVGTQSGKKDEYEEIQALVKPGTVIIDDANPLEIMELLQKHKADILVGGVKERYLSYKLGIPFCDYNHDRKVIFEGFDGVVNFAQEVHETINSPVWRLNRG